MMFIMFVQGINWHSITGKLVVVAIKRIIKALVHIVECIEFIRGDSIQEEQPIVTVRPISWYSIDC